MCGEYQPLEEDSFVWGVPASGRGKLCEVMMVRAMVMTMMMMTTMMMMMMTTKSSQFEQTRSDVCVSNVVSEDL